MPPVRRIGLTLAILLAVSACGESTPNISESPDTNDPITVLTSLTPDGLTCFEVTAKDFNENICNGVDPEDRTKVRAPTQLDEFSSSGGVHILFAIGSPSVVSKPTGVAVVIEGKWVIIYDPVDKLAEEFLMMSVDGTNFACKAPDNFVKEVSCRLPQYWTASK